MIGKRLLILAVIGIVSGACHAVGGYESSTRPARRADGAREASAPVDARLVVPDAPTPPADAAIDTFAVSPDGTVDGFTVPPDSTVDGFTVPPDSTVDSFTVPPDSTVDSFTVPPDSTVDGGCVAPSIVCGTKCVNPGFDPDHCGGCDSPCGAMELCCVGNCWGEPYPC